ncbi:TPA: DNA alkylation repair protein [Pasteurella multocida]|nr:DNA alkylation repair protein [Pasteurella multocida]HDR1861971.1 DNA alkylation repair protein [Pasteurella multocida]
MAKKLKDYYDVEYLKHLSNLLTKESPSFDQDRFLDLTKSIHELEFSQRQERIATALYEAFDLSYEETLSVFYKILGPILKGNSGAFTEGWWLWPIGRYVEIYGDSHFEVSVNFSKALTKRFTSEYCMRMLIKKYPEESMKILLDWSTDENERVRRLSSEGLRIRLPWAKKLYTALEYFDQYFEILSNLKDDKDKYIQKSVANNLNDLYKEKSEKFYEIINAWEKEEMSKECRWVIKHGSRNVAKN